MNRNKFSSEEIMLTQLENIIQINIITFRNSLLVKEASPSPLIPVFRMLARHVSGKVVGRKRKGRVKEER